MTTAELTLICDADNRRTSWAAALVAQETSLDEAQRIAQTETTDAKFERKYYGGKTR